MYLVKLVWLKQTFPLKKYYTSYSYSFSQSPHSYNISKNIAMNYANVIKSEYVPFLFIVLTPNTDVSINNITSIFSQRSFSAFLV